MAAASVQAAEQLARSIHNDFIDALRGAETSLPPYPVQSRLTAQFRQQALAAGRTDMVSLWSGQGAPLLKHRRAGELMHALVQETHALIQAAR